mmetsp:Transcript_28450/g.69358  ORF Transcript_28450/g.69358 Transcript_28450/m.69358 type:complete len:124 (-) Transcript_28450:422-793(-)
MSARSIAFLIQILKACKAHSCSEGLADEHITRRREHTATCHPSGCARSESTNIDAWLLCSLLTYGLSWQSTAASSSEHSRDTSSPSMLPPSSRLRLGLGDHLPLKMQGRRPEGEEEEEEERRR